MKPSCRTRAARAAFMLAAVVAFVLPLNARGTAFAHSQYYRMDAPSADDDELLFFGNPLILTNHSDRMTNRAWMQFKTDPCGMLMRVENRQSMVTQSGFSDNFDDLDDFDDGDPADLGREMIGRWLSEHPEIAVINDGVDKGCDSGWYDGEERRGDFEAQRLIQNKHGLPGVIKGSEIA